MKRFLDAMDVLEGYEGVYSNNKLDPGGETFRGISRVYYPDWWGWQIIDEEDDLQNESVARDLDRLVLNFYRMQFWNRFQGDKVADLSMNVAIEMLECSVNLGVHRCTTFLQQAINLLNRNEKLYPDMVEDGKLGTVTLSRLDRYLSSRPPDRKTAEQILVKVMNHLQGGYYIEKMKRYPEKEEFRGWFNRT